MARLLQQAAASDVGPVLIDSLPVLGVDGTLRNRLTRANAAGSGYLRPARWPMCARWPATWMPSRAAAMLW